MPLLPLTYLLCLALRKRNEKAIKFGKKRAETEQARQQAEQARQNAIPRLLGLGLTVEQVAEALSLSVADVQAFADSL